jgi:hypothetical protein
MPKVPEIPASTKQRLKPTDTLIVCGDTTNRGDKITDSDAARLVGLNDLINFVKTSRHKRQNILKRDDGGSI